MKVINDNKYKVQKGDTLSKIARENGLSVKQLLAMNPELSADDPLKIDDEITLPSDGYEYVTKAGDNLTKIAEENGVRVEALFSANPDIPQSGTININQKITVPSQYYAYTVKPGDALYGIAKEQSGGDINVNLLKRANPEIPENGVISVGQRLRIPTGYYMHTMRKGETYYALQKAYNVSTEELGEANPGLDKNDLSINQKIRIPSPSVQIASFVRETKVVLDEIKPKVPVKGEASKVFNSSTGLRGYNLPSSNATRRAMNAAKKGITHAPVKSQGDKPLIVIDLGHNYKSSHGQKHGDPGTVSKDGTLMESQIVDAVGASLVKQLADKGYRVAFTRNPGEIFEYVGGHNQSLERRAIFATNLEREIKAPYTVFVSLHVNSAAGNGGRGYEVKVPDRIGTGKNQKDFKSKSYKLRKSLTKNMKEGFYKSNPRHAHEQSLSMFRKFAKTAYGSDAAVLIELEFLNNKRGQNILQSMKDKPYSVAASIAKGIEGYVKQESPGLKLSSAPKLTN